MSTKPIYIDRGEGKFERFAGTLADLQIPGWPDFFPGRFPPGVSNVSPAADHVYYKEDAPADLLTMTPPTVEVWESLSRFIATKRVDE
jgi:hypothetical protein